MSASTATRSAECSRLLLKHPNTLPLALENISGKHAKVQLVALPRTATVADVITAVREAADVAHNRRAVSIAVAGCVPSASTSVADLHANCQAEDGFLYVQYTVEKKMGTAVALPCFGYANGGADSSDKLDNAYGGIKDDGSFNPGNIDAGTAGQWAGSNGFTA